MFFEAIFSPVNQKEYNSEAAGLVGKKLPVKEGWIIDDGPYKGQQCYYAPNTKIGKIPISDLQEWCIILRIKKEDLTVVHSM